MPLATAVEHQVMTTYSSFGLMGDGDSAIEDLAAGDVLVCGDGLCIFKSGSSDHVAEVRYEIWDSLPVPIIGWEAAEYGVAELDGTEFERHSLAITRDIGEPIPELPRIAVQPIWYNVEAWVVGRSRSRQTHAYGAVGLERWLIRLSPRQS